jgi:hypothetical protein
MGKSWRQIWLDVARPAIFSGVILAPKSSDSLVFLSSACRDSGRFLTTCVPVVIFKMHDESRLSPLASWSNTFSDRATFVT